MRIAFFGGTFDPPHCGHLKVAQEAADRLHLDRVLFAPVAKQPFKEAAASAGFDDRVAMVRLAIHGDARFEVSLEDAVRGDGRPNYTIDSITHLKKTSDTKDHLYCLIGADSFLDFPKWHRAAELVFLCDVIVAARPGFQLDEIGKGLPQGIHVEEYPQKTRDVTTLALTDGSRSATLFLLPDLEEDVSATGVRAAIAGRASASNVLPQKVAEYIRTHHLYR